ncbi:hypothetical protein L1887_49834 [Cichorium endivia]|nr:hypothetical protein L1887_49834 [Cichorium endivia]
MDRFDDRAIDDETKRDTDGEKGIVGGHRCSTLMDEPDVVDGERTKHLSGPRGSAHDGANRQLRAKCLARAGGKHGRAVDEIGADVDRTLAVFTRQRRPPEHRSSEHQSGGRVEVSCRSRVGAEAHAGLYDGCTGSSGEEIRHERTQADHAGQVPLVAARPVQRIVSIVAGGGQEDNVSIERHILDSAGSSPLVNPKYKSENRAGLCALELASARQPRTFSSLATTPCEAECLHIQHPCTQQTGNFPRTDRDWRECVETMPLSAKLPS